MKLKAGKNSVLIRVMPDEKDLAERSSGGIYFPTFMRVLKYRIQYGTAISVGSNIEGIEKGNVVFIHHATMSNSERLVDFDSVTGSEVWCVRVEKANCEIFGWMRDDEIIPMPHYIVSKPERSDESIMNFSQQEKLFTKKYEQDTSKHYKTKVIYKNPVDTNIEVGDTLLCRPVSNYEIKYRQEIFWFIDLQNTRAIISESEKLKVLDKVKAQDQQQYGRFNWTTINDPIVQSI